MHAISQSCFHGCRRTVNRAEPVHQTNTNAHKQRLLNILSTVCTTLSSLRFIDGASYSSQSRKVQHTNNTAPQIALCRGIHIEERDLEVEKEYTMSSLTVVPSSF